MNNQLHLDYIDLAKGFGIILVILGHGMFPNHFLIDSFHMALFFILSGVTFTVPSVIKADITQTWLLKKVDRILIPYIFFMIISGLIELFAGKLNSDSSFNSPLWFLQTLLWASIIYYGASLYISRLWITVICIIIIISTYYVYNYTSIPYVIPFDLYRSIVSMVFIHIGVLISHFYKKDQNRFISLLIAIITAIIFGLTFLYCSNHYSTAWGGEAETI